MTRLEIRLQAFLSTAMSALKEDLLLVTPQPLGTGCSNPPFQALMHDTILRRYGASSPPAVRADFVIPGFGICMQPISWFRTTRDPETFVASHLAVR